MRATFVIDSKRTVVFLGRLPNQYRTRHRRLCASCVPFADRAVVPSGLGGGR